MKLKILKRINILTVALLICSNTYCQQTFFTTTDNVQLHLSIKGEGIPCLFIHGGPGQGSYYWEKLAGEVGEKHFKMIYLDQRGCGQSTSPEDGNYGIERVIKDFEEIRESLGIDHWLIMGHSFGGILQTYYASLHPESIKGILMFNCTLDMQESLEKSYIPSVVKFFEIKDKNMYTNQALPLSARLDSLQKLFMTREDVWKLSFSTLESAIQFGESFSDFDKWNFDFRSAAPALDEYLKDYSILTKTIQKPVLYLYSAEDNNVGPNQYKKLQFPNLLLRRINGSHMEFINNQNAYISAVDEFINHFGIE